MSFSGRLGVLAAELCALATSFQSAQSTHTLTVHQLAQIMWQSFLWQAGARFMFICQGGVSHGPPVQKEPTAVLNPEVKARISIGRGA